MKAGFIILIPYLQNSVYLIKFDYQYEIKNFHEQIIIRNRRTIYSMRFLCVIGGLLTYAYATANELVARNYIKNGDFSQNFIGRNEWVITNELPGWEAPKQVEQGLGKIYNNKWGNTVVVELDSNQNDILRQKLDLQGGEYILELDYAARSNYVTTSQMSVSWNGQKVKTVKAQDDEIHFLRLPVTAISGRNTLEISGEGPSDTYGMTIANVRLTGNSVANSNGGVDLEQNFFLNGNFQNAPKPQGREWIGSLYGWDVKRVRFGVGNLWNKKWGDKCVIELDENLNNSLRQTIELSEGLHRFQLDYSVAENCKNLPSFSVWINGVKASQVSAEDNEIHTSSLNFDVKKAGQFSFEIRGENSVSGLTIGRIAVFRSSGKIQSNGKLPCLDFRKQ